VVRVGRIALSAAWLVIGLDERASSPASDEGVGQIPLGRHLAE
jgi:hypothetical protein